MGFHKWFKVWYGYPAYSQHYKYEEKCLRCRKRRITTDNLFVERRPKEYIINRDYIVKT